MWDFLTEHWRDGVEIIILAALAYHGYLFFRATRGARILTGLLILLLTRRRSPAAAALPVTPATAAAAIRAIPEAHPASSRFAAASHHLTAILQQRYGITAPVATDHLLAALAAVGALGLIGAAALEARKHDVWKRDVAAGACAELEARRGTAMPLEDHARSLSLPLASELARDAAAQMAPHVDGDEDDPNMDEAAAAGVTHSEAALGAPGVERSRYADCH